MELVQCNKVFIIFVIIVFFLFFCFKQDKNKSSIAKPFCEMNYAFDLNSVKIFSKPSSTHKIYFIEPFYVYKNANNIVNCKSAILLLSDCWKYYVKTCFT